METVSLRGIQDVIGKHVNMNAKSFNKHGAIYSINS